LKNEKPMNLLNKFKANIRNETFDYIIFFYSCVFFITVSIITLPINYLLGASRNIFVFLVSSILLNCFFIYVAIHDRKKFTFIKLGFLINLYSLFIFYWFFSGGIDGPTLMYFVLMLMLSIALSDTVKLLIILVCLNILIANSLLYINLFMSYAIVEYPSQVDRMVDIVISYFVLAFIVIIVSQYLLSDYKEISKQLQAEHQKLENLTFTDPLTQLWNRRYVERQLNNEFNRFQRNGNLVTIVMFDVDLFKSINDTFGHDVGDKTLVHVSQILKTSLRISDCVARFGGEEFLTILPDTGLEEAVNLAERVRLLINKEQLEILGGRKVSISGGVATIQKDSKTIEEIVKTADAMLYKAKSEGRNKIAW
jgi:diguanylate cyclase (GGDEF)-like protein